MTSSDDTAIPSYTDLLRLDGRGIIVVGAGQGIGRQTAHAVSQAGARVFCIDNEPALASEIAAEVGGIAHVADARDRSSVDAAVGFFYHSRGVLRRPGGTKHLVYNIIYGPPIFAPLLFGAAGINHDLDIRANRISRGPYQQLIILRFFETRLGSFQ